MTALQAQAPARERAVLAVPHPERVKAVLRRRAETVRQATAVLAVAMEDRLVATVADGNAAAFFTRR